MSTALGHRTRRGHLAAGSAAVLVLLGALAGCAGDPASAQPEPVTEQTGDAGQQAAGPAHQFHGQPRVHGGEAKRIALRETGGAWRDIRGVHLDRAADQPEWRIDIRHGSARRTVHIDADSGEVTAVD